MPLLLFAFTLCCRKISISHTPRHAFHLPLLVLLLVLINLDIHLIYRWNNGLLVTHRYSKHEKLGRVVVRVSIDAHTEELDHKKDERNKIRDWRSELADGYRQEDRPSKGR